jgi:prepilin-type N-terminal cleavage/methylation domain-containing protein
MPCPTTLDAVGAAAGLSGRSLGATAGLSSSATCHPERSGHPERSEGSLQPRAKAEILRCAQDDTLSRHAEKSDRVGPPRCWPRRPRGFTLVELLVTITVLGILLSLVFAAMRAATNSAKVAKTKATIAKLHQIIMAKYESYLTRRVQVDLVSFCQNNGSYTSQYNSTPAKALARARVNAIRDLMRLEMPDRWNDVLSSDSDTTGVSPLIMDPNMTAVAKTAGTTVVLAATKLYMLAYQNAKSVAGSSSAAATADRPKYSSAKCLYMIVMSDPDAARLFAADEIGTVDASGMPVFLDAWNRPIYWLRWPAGFIAGNLPGSQAHGANFGADGDLQTGDTTNDHDPFDPRKYFGDAFAVYPLIYSAGPDGRSDINVGTDGRGNTTSIGLTGGDIDPYTPDANSLYVGQPWPSASFNGDAALTFPATGSHDNIHNHHIEAR